VRGRKVTSGASVGYVLALGERGARRQVGLLGVWKGGEGGVTDGVVGAEAETEAVGGI
jgi:hypothetical protein